MQLKLTKDRILQSDSCRIGYCKENNSECLNIQIEDEALHYRRAYIEFQVNDGKTYTTDALEIVNGVVSYSVPNGLVSEAGFLYMQVVLRDDENNVSKSNVIMFTIDKAINAEDDLVVEYPDLINRINETLNKVDNQEEEINALRDAKQDTLISGENIKTINEESLLGSGNIDMKGIINVEELPSAWKGTPLPSNYVGKVYFNINLTKEEVKKLTEKTSLGVSNYVFYKAYNPNNVEYLMEYISFTRFSYDDGYRIIFSTQARKDENSITSSSKDIYTPSSGWFLKEVELIQITEGTTYTEVDNASISHLVSITPFEKVDLSKSIYRLPDSSLWVYRDDKWIELSTRENSGIIDVNELPDKWIGTPLPKNHAGKVYFNTNLSVDEVNELLDKHILTNGTYYIHYGEGPIIDGKRDTEFIYIAKNNSGYSIYKKCLDANSNIFNKGWIENQLTLYLGTIYPNTKCSYQNKEALSNLLSSLVSITPFKKVDPNVIYRLPDGTLWVYHNDEWKELGGSNDEDDSLQLIDLTEYKRDDILSSDVADKIRSLGKRAVLFVSDPSYMIAHYSKTNSSGINFTNTKLSSNMVSEYQYTLNNDNSFYYQLTSSLFATTKMLTDLKNAKQDILVSGGNIKTINGQSLLGEGDITIKGGSGGSAGVQLKLVESLENDSDVLSGGKGIELTTNFKPNTIYMVTYFSNPFAETISTLLPIGFDGCAYVRAIISGDDGCTCSGYIACTSSNISFNLDDDSITLDPINKLEIYELTSGGSSIDGEIIEVDELPNAWKGTPITKDTTRVYFNTSLSYQEIKYLFSKIYDPFHKYDSETIIGDYEGSYNLAIMVNGDYKIQIEVDFGDDVYYTKEDGWIFDGNYIDIDYEIYSLTEYANTLSPLFSSTPFEKVDIDTNAFYRLPDGSLWKYQDGWKAYIPEDISMAIQSSNIKLNMLHYDDSNNWSYNGKCTVSIPINDTLRNLLEEGKLRLQLVKLNKRGRKKGTGIRGWSFPKIPFGVGSKTFNNEKNDDSYGVGKDYPENSINPFIELDSSNISENGKYIVSNPIDVREIARCMCYYQDSMLLVSAELDTDNTQCVVRPTSDIDHDGNSYGLRIVGSDHRDNYKSSVIRFRIALTHKDDYNVYSMSESIIKIRYVPYNPDSNPDKPLFLISTLIE